MEEPSTRELSKILLIISRSAWRVLFSMQDKIRKVERVMELSVDQQYIIREQLKEQGLVAFVADKAVLPRESGVSAKPMKGAVPFASPESMKVTMDLPVWAKSQVWVLKRNHFDCGVAAITENLPF